jgi:hypothetical protein
MTSIIDALIKQVPPPAQTSYQPNSDDWLNVEEKLGLSLPDEYKTIIGFYGDFYWSDFFHLLNPFSSNKYLNLFTQLEMILEAERDMRKMYPEHYPLPLYPEANGLLPFFMTDNGDTGFWITYLQPEKWSILIKAARSPEFEVSFFKTAMFLYQFTGGRFQSTILPKLA